MDTKQLHHTAIISYVHTLRVKPTQKKKNKHTKEESKYTISSFKKHKPKPGPNAPRKPDVIKLADSRFAKDAPLTATQGSTFHRGGVWLQSVQLFA